MKFNKFIIFILTLLVFGCDGSYQSNDDEMISELNNTNAVKFVAGGSGNDSSQVLLSSTDGKSCSFG